MRNNMKFGIFLFGLFSLLTINVLAQFSPSEDNAKLVNNVGEPVTISRSYLLLALTHEELSNYSDTIVIGTVKEILPGRWNTIDGKAPDASAEIGPFNLIYTDIVISVNKYLKNPLSSGDVIVRVEGGTVGNNSMAVEDQPGFETGEKVFLYLSKDNSPGTKGPGPDHFVVTGLMQGKFTLTDDGKAIRPGENTTLNDLLSSINQTNNKITSTGISNNTGTAGMQAENSNYTQETKNNPKSKSTPFISSIWALAAVFGAVVYIRKRK